MDPLSVAAPYLGDSSFDPVQYGVQRAVAIRADDAAKAKKQEDIDAKDGKLKESYLSNLDIDTKKISQKFIAGAMKLKEEAKTGFTEDAGKGLRPWSPQTVNDIESHNKTRKKLDDFENYAQNANEVQQWLDKNDALRMNNQGKVDQVETARRTAELDAAGHDPAKVKEVLGKYGNVITVLAEPNFDYIKEFEEQYKSPIISETGSYDDQGNRIEKTVSKSFDVQKNRDIARGTLANPNSQTGIEAIKAELVKKGLDPAKATSAERDQAKLDAEETLYKNLESRADKLGVKKTLSNASEDRTNFKWNSGAGYASKGAFDFVPEVKTTITTTSNNTLDAEGKDIAGDDYKDEVKTPSITIAKQNGVEIPPMDIAALKIWDNATGKPIDNKGAAKVTMRMSSIEKRDISKDGKFIREWVVVGKMLKFDKNGNQTSDAEDVSVPLDNNAEGDVLVKLGLTKAELEKLKQEAEGLMKEKPASKPAAKTPAKATPAATNKWASKKRNK